MRLLVVLTPALIGLAPVAAAAHVLDAERVQTELAEIARFHRTVNTAADETGRTESLFRLGQAVETLVELLDHDVATHGGDDLLVQLVVQRLQAYGINVARSPRTRRYTYDLGAFREYLRRAPAGRWAPDARYRLIAGRFHEMPPPDAAPGADGDLLALLDAVRDEERFLRDHAAHERAPLVRFYLGVDSYRVARAAADEAVRREYAGRARRALEMVARTMPGTAEARAAEVLLERLSEQGFR